MNKLTLNTVTVLSNSLPYPVYRLRVKTVRLQSRSPPTDLQPEEISNLWKDFY